MITEMDNLKAQNMFDLIDASSLEPKLKADLKESLEESKLNLNGRTLEERCASIARAQFDMTRFICDIIIQFKNMTDDAKKNQANTKKTCWKDVIIAVKWPVCVLGGIALVCSIFNTEIVNLLTAIVKLF